MGVVPVKVEAINIFPRDHLGQCHFPGLPDERLDQFGLNTHFFDRRGRLRPIFDPKLVAQLEDFEVDDVLVDVEPTWVRVPPEAVTRLFRSTRVTSGSSTPLVPGMVLDSTGAVDDGKTSVRDPSPGLTT